MRAHEVIIVAVLAGCSGRHQAPAKQAPTDAAPAPDPEAAALAGFDAALARVGLRRADADGDAIRTSSCDGAKVTIQYQGKPVEVGYGSCHRCELVGSIDATRIAELAAAFDENPPAFYRAAGVTQVALCARLAPETAAASEEGKLIGGTTDQVRGMILLSLEPMPLSGQEIVHHELFHLFDFVTDFGLYKDDPAWKALNTTPYGHSDEVLPGYLDAHARDNLREDHATTYQYLMARPAALCASDAIVLAKARMIRDRIAGTLGDASYLERRAPCLLDAQLRP